MNELALFAGAGGGLLASRWLLDHRIVCYVENDPYCVKVIKARIGNGLLHDAPIWDDARTFNGKPWRGKVDLISAGFPCQPFSVAGKRRGEDDERNMWPETIRVIREVGPPFVFLDNVPGLLAGHGYFGRILGDLAEAGFDAEWCVLSAADVGASHIRKRLWVLAYTERGRRNRLHEREQQRHLETIARTIRSGPSGRTPPGKTHVADADEGGRLGRGKQEWAGVESSHRSEPDGCRPDGRLEDASIESCWEAVSRVGGTLDGLASRLELR